MSLKIKYKPLPHQALFHSSAKPKVYLSGGYGSGKTYSLVMHILKLMHMNPGMPGGLLCPTLKMYKRDVLPTFLSICRENGIPFKYNKTENEWFFPKAYAHMYVYHAEDDGMSIRGANLAWGAINEVTLCSKEAFLAFLARIRLKKARFPQLAMSGTPEEFNWAYEYFIENPRADTDLIFGDMRANPYLHDSYVQNLLDSYDPLMVQAYVEGKFVNMKGRRAAWAFDRHKHVSREVEKIPEYPTWVSVDFNVTPMAATLWNFVPQHLSDDGRMKNQARLIAYDEIKLTNSNTFELCSTLKEKLNLRTEDVTIYPDPTGGSRTTASRGGSDLDILRDSGFLKIKFKNRISVKDCLNALNNQLSKDAILVSHKCTNLIADMEQCVLKEGQYEIDKANLMRTHWLDGAKNMVDYEFPIQRISQSRTERIR